jgi:formylglycine-generating enzyme required for sulfatase activity
MNCVSYLQARSFCTWAAKRLPTLQEWSLAAFVAGSDLPRAYPWGSADLSSSRLNVCGTECAGKIRGIDTPFETSMNDSYPATARVGLFPEGRSPLGLDDLLGNVWEWTTSTPSKRPDTRIVAGGGWETTSKQSLVIGGWTAVGMNERRATLGFRCAK